jgi:sterol desaturase/sphingolipid hydroxylase (fatty acid hydroxylase superfamily)
MVVKKILLTILITALSVEIMGYFWHKLAAHYGLIGDKIRKTHYEHHEVYYPFNDMESDVYRVDGLLKGDAWPWLIPVLIVLIFVTWIRYKNFIDKMVYYIIVGWVACHVYLISYVHDSYHVRNHWLNRFTWYQKNKHYHNLHHYYNCNYGISNYSMDYLFGTLVTDYDKARPMEDIFQGYKRSGKSRTELLRELTK